MEEINVLHIEGYSSTNIGNAFYNLGIKHVLKSLQKKINLYTASDLQTYAWDRYNSKNASSFNPCEHFEDMDYVIWSGPMMSAKDVEDWKNILHKAEISGTKIICLSAGGNQYSHEEVKEVREILGQFRLYALFTRDYETYENYKDLFEYSYNGICCAFYIPEYFKPWKLDIEPYVIFNFENSKEPLFVKADEGFEFVGSTWCKGGVAGAISKRLFRDKGYSECAFNGLNIIRTKNTCFEPLQKKYFGHNIYISDVPEDYLNIYANAKAVFSDRVHTCVGALSQGIPTMFMGNTPRANLFKRILGESYGNIFHEPISIAVPNLDMERENLRISLGEVLI